MPENQPIQGSSPSKSQKLHYRLTNEEWVQAVRTLKPAEKDVLYYLRTLDPFGDRYLDLGVREIARILDYDPGTVSRALKSLDAQQYINIDLLRVGVRIRIRNPDPPPPEAVPIPPIDPPDLPAETDPEPENLEKLDPKEGCCSDATLLSPRNKCCSDATSVVLTQHLLSVDNTWPLEPPSCKGSGTPHTIHTLHTLLNKKERERREAFSTEQAEANQAEPIPPDCPPSPEPTESPPPPQEPPEGTEGSAAAAEDEFFDWVLTYKIPRLPQKPASPRSAARGWIEKHGPQLQAEYQTWLAGPQREATDHSGTPPPPRLPPPMEETPEDRIQRYQTLWQNPVCRSGIRRAIEDNPDWNLVIGPDGPKEKTDDDPEPNPSEAPPI